MKNLFSIVSDDFFKPLTSKYKRVYIDCIQLIFNTYKPELSYGVDRDIVLATLESYFEENSTGSMEFEDENTIANDSRQKANAVIKILRDCKWLEYENVENYRINVVLQDYAATMIESFNKIMKDDELEYQSVISQIYATLLNKDSYSKPYEYILKRINDNTEELISGLKKLNISIKKHMDQQTNEMDTKEILEHFFNYHKSIGSKAYLRMKTSDNVSYFRNSIIEKLDMILQSNDILSAAVDGYMDIEQVLDREVASEAIVNIIMNIKSSFYRLDDMIEEIDRKHAKYQQSAVMRAKFLLSTGNNVEGKILRILNYLSDEFNKDETMNMYDDISEDLLYLFDIFPQRFLDKESLKTIVVSKKIGMVEDIGEDFSLSDDERNHYLSLWNERNKNRFSRKNINAYVEELLEKQDRVAASALTINNRRDMIRIIFISLYGRNVAGCYKIEQKNYKVTRNEFTFTDFDIIRR
jgi:hypothetical protein